MQLTRSRTAYLLRVWHLPQALIVLAFTVGAQLVSPTLVPLPQVYSFEPVRAPVSVLAAFACALAVLGTCGEPVSTLPSTAAVRVDRVRRLRMIGLTLVAALCVALPLPDYAPGACVALLTLIGEGLVVSALFGSSIAWLVPMAHVLAAASVGSLEDGLAGWAWVVKSEATPGSLLLALSFYLVGLRMWSTALDRA